MKSAIRAIALACLAPATWAQAAPHTENTGQDPTNPVTRFDIRAKYTQHVNDSENEVLTFRIDRPFKFDNGWKINTRFDLPMVRNDAVSPDNPNGDYEMGLSDFLAQALFIAPAQGRTTYFFGTQVIAPTGSQDQMTSGRWQLAPTLGFVNQLPRLSPGSFIGLLVKDKFSFGGNKHRAQTNDLSIQPILNINLPNRWFMTFSPEVLLNLDHEMDMFVPFDMTIGRKINDRTVMSLTADAGLGNDYEQYDWQLEGRVGFFF